MRTCQDYEMLISAWIDGCLPEAERTELMGNMAVCPVCQRYFDDQIAIHEAMMALEELPAPADLSGRIMAQVRETAQETPVRTGKRTVRFPSWRRWAALAACCAVAAAGLWGLRPESAAGNQAVPQMAAYSDAAVPAAENGEISPQSKLRSGDAPLQEEASAAAQVQKDAAVASSDLKEDRAPEEAPAPALASPNPADAAVGIAGDAGPWAGKLTTASPVAGAWVEEQLALAWTAGGVYELTAEEYQTLRAALEEAGEAFAVTAGQPEAARYLLEAAEK